MAIDATDWTIDRATRNIRYTGDDHGGASPTYATVLELKEWVAGLADDEQQASTDDDLAIYDPDPIDRSTDNIMRLKGDYNITATEAEHLYDGTIIQGSGTSLERWDGIVNYGNSTVQIQIIQDGAVLTDDWWNFGGGGLNADASNGISHQFMIKTIDNGCDIDGRRLIGTSRTFGNSYAEFKINGTSQGNNTLALSDADDLNNETSGATVATWDQFANDNEGYIGIDVNNDATDEYYYSKFSMNNGSTPASPTINDLYEWWKYQQRDGSAATLYGLAGELFRGITHEITYDGATNGGPVEGNILAWGTTFNYSTELSSGLTVGAYYNFNTSNAKGQLLALDDDGTTGFCVFAIQPGSGTVVNTETFTRADGTANDGATVNSAPVGTSDVGGTGMVLADDTVDQVWIQVLKGVAPTDNMVMYEATTAGVHDTATDGTATVNVTITERTVSFPTIGASTGSALIGGYGIGVRYLDLTSADKVFDLTDTQYSTPNNQTFTVGPGLVNTEDRVLVAPWDGTTTDAEGDPEIDYNQFTLNTSLLGATETAVVVTTAIPTDTPSSGTIRVQLDDGRYWYQSYTSWTGSTFTIPSTDYSVATGNGGATQPKNVFISYIDKIAGASGSETYTATYTSDRDLVVIVRDGGSTPIKQFISSAVFGSTGGSSTPIRTSDA